MSEFTGREMTFTQSAEARKGKKEKKRKRKQPGTLLNNSLSSISPFTVLIFRLLLLTNAPIVDEQEHLSLSLLQLGVIIAEFHFSAT